MDFRKLWPFVLALLIALAGCSDPEDCATFGDEDGDGDADCDDSDCADIPTCNADPEICDNGVDDNGNGAIDCQEVSCASQPRCQPETPCNDGLDNNQNGDTDCDDDDCTGDPACVEVGECNDNLDNDGDGFTDCDDADCNSPPNADPVCFPEDLCGQGNFVCCGDNADNNQDGDTDCEDASCQDECVVLNCGNGTLDPGEVCDDGNTNSGDCCAPTCDAVTCFILDETEPNNSSPTANGPLQVPSTASGVISPGSDLDFFSIDLPGQGILILETTDEGGPGSCTSTTDTVLTLFNTNGTTVIDSEDQGGISNCSKIISPSLPPGIYFAKVEDFQNNSVIDGYQLHVSGQICGNGAIEGGEQCDDGNTNNGDGCDSTCETEPVCGDNTLISPPEQCDDGKHCDDGVGAIPGTPCFAEATCAGIGDGLCIARSGDGCDANCKITACGNGVTTGVEECDDGNNVNGDGCDTNCTFSVCGNTIVAGTEQCDGTNLSGQSCVTLGFASGTLTCNADCTQNATACVASICGNGVTETGEQCDDNNLIDNDGCSSGCQFEIIAEVEPNNTAATATGPFSSPFLTEGAITDTTDEIDFYSFTLTSFGALQIETFDGAGPTTCNNIATTVDLIGTDGTTVLVTDNSTGPNSCSFIGPNPPGNDANAKNLAPGTYFIRVVEFQQNASIAAYRLRLTLLALCGNNVTEVGELCDDGNLAVGDGCDNQCRTEICGNNRVDANEECDDNNTADGDCCSSACDIEPGCVPDVEPNNTAAQASGPLSNGSKAFADINPNGDVDFYSIVLPGIVDLKLETQNATNTNCSTAQDTLLKFFDPNGTTQIASNNDISGTNRCSRLDGTNTATMQKLQPGTYFASVEKNGTPAIINDYRLVVTFVALCGNGATEGTEICDDGNQANGDGCENNCILTPACGNGNVEPGEECDDNNLNNGDGCDAACQREPVCGDGFVDSPESCDDSNTTDGDCCSSACQIEPGCFAEIEPNNNSTQTVVALGHNNQGFGSINPIGDVDFYAIVVPSESDLKLETTNGTATPCGTNQDTVLKFFAPNGTTVIATNNDIGANRCSRLDATIGANPTTAAMRNLAPGTYFASVDENGNNGVINKYNLVVTFVSACGNNVTEQNEACDDGNLTDGDGCEANCTITPACGNNLTEGAEQCDDGNLNNGDGCNQFCQDEFCGDGIVNDVNETCDDTNLSNNDDCLNNCQLAACGDGVVFSGVEDCDNGANNSDTAPNACRTTCEFAGCGDGTIDNGEQCDDNNNNPGDGCDSICKLEFCGDGIDNNGNAEQCDDGNGIDNDGCTNSCEVAGCGDGIVFDFTQGGSEECDDGNLSTGDGCDDFCFIERIIEIEPNGSIAEAQATGISVDLDQMILGAVNPVGDADFYEFTLDAPKVMRIETFDANFGSCVAINTVIEIFNSAGTKLTTADGGGIGFCSKAQIALGAGTFYVSVTESGNNAAIPAYSLFIDFP